MADSGRPVSPSRCTASLIFEQHLGHRTFGENLLAAAASDERVQIEWHPVDYRWTITDRLSRIPRLSTASGPLAGRHQVRRALRSGDADVWVYNTQVPAALAGTRRRSPYVVITDVTPVQYDAMASGYGHRPDRPGPLRRWKHRVNERVFQSAAHCVGWSSWVTGSMQRDYGVDPARVSVIPPGVDLTRWTPGGARAGSTVRVLFVGGDFERKGGDLLLRALPSLPEHVEMWIVTKSAVPQSERVHVFNDFEPNDPRLERLFGEVDLFVLPSRAETFGIAAVEASASGLPVVASDVGGLPDIVGDGSTGILVPPGDLEQLTRALATLSSDRQLRSRFGTAARAHAVEHFDATRNAQRLIDVALEAAGHASRQAQDS